MSLNPQVDQKANDPFEVTRKVLRLIQELESIRTCPNGAVERL